jgi:tRNA(fMet)-specific endonuclease VapC
MIYLWDTDTCVHFLNGDGKIRQKIQAVGAKNICTTIVNIMELKFGAYNSTRIEENLARIEQLQQKLTILDDFDENIVTFFAKNKAALRKKGITISDFDLLIASFAGVYHMKLITNNVKHLSHVKGIKVENWLAE